MFINLGAISSYLKHLDNPMSDYANFRYVMPSGHELMSQMKTVLKILMEYGADELAPGYGFSSPKSKQVLFLGYDTHICMDFILEVKFYLLLLLLLLLLKFKNILGISSYSCS